MLKELDNNNFANETKDGLKLIEFYASWCGYCKKQISELKEMDKVWIGQVDVDKQAELASKYNISSLPTFIIMRNGKEADRLVGFKAKEDLMNRMLPHLF